MSVTPRAHLRRQGLVPEIEGGQSSHPPLGFRMPGVSGLALGQYIPQTVQFAVFPEQVLPTEKRWREIPDPHLKFWYIPYSHMSNS